MKITDQQLIELINFSISLDFEAKKRWQSYVPYLQETDRQKLYDTLRQEKKQVSDVMKKNLKGFRGYFFARNLESLEKRFMDESSK